MKKTLFTILTLVLTVAIGAQIANAIGSLTPTGTVGDDTQYSLNDIYDKLVNFADTPTATSTPFTTPVSVTASFRTLSEIYDLLTAENSDLVASKIATGTSIFGVTGTLPITPVLEWSTEQTGGAGLDWGYAVSICSGTVDGSTGWRLPTISELLAGISDDWIIDQGGDQGDSFGNGINYWSGTDYDGNYAWIAGWNTSVSYFGDLMTYEYQVRCVR